MRLPTRLAPELRNLRPQLLELLSLGIQALANGLGEHAQHTGGVIVRVVVALRAEKARPLGEDALQWGGRCGSIKRRTKYSFVEIGKWSYIS